MPYPQIIIYPTMKAHTHLNLDGDLYPEVNGIPGFVYCILNCVGCPDGDGSLLSTGDHESWEAVGQGEGELDCSYQVR